MYDRGTLNWLIGNCYDRIYSLQGESNDLADKIDRLRSARSTVRAIYNDDVSFVSWVDYYDVGANWQGVRREEFEEYKRSAKNSGTSYCQHVWDIHESISRKINELESRRSDISWEIMSQYANIGSLRWMLAWASLE